MPDFSYERAAARQGLVCGVDEAGRGPLAGPVVAAAVILDRRRAPKGLDDSKKLTPESRAELCALLWQRAQVGVGAASVADIERLNILGATMLAMVRAVAALPMQPDVALVDGNRAPKLACAVETVIGGDGLSLSIAAASIVAKVTRDRIMCALAPRWPAYGFERHMGYATAAHREALTRFGPTPHHRRSFAGVLPDMVEATPAESALTSWNLLDS